MIDGCILPEVVERIDRTDPEQWVWDSLGSFLEVNKSSFNRLFDPCSNPLAALADWAPAPRRAEVARLKEKATEVVALQEALEREKQAREEERQTSEETVRKAEAEVANLVE